MDSTGLHLLRETPAEDRPTFTGPDTTVAPGYPRYVPPTEATPRGRVHLNPDAYFDGGAPETWAMQVGGYQPLDKWLKDRRTRTLSYDDVQHYERTAAALAATRRLMHDVDAAIEAHGGFPLA